jgi:hypothetical protein
VEHHEISNEDIIEIENNKESNDKGKKVPKTIIHKVEKKGLVDKISSGLSYIAKSVKKFFYS